MNPRLGQAGRHCVLPATRHRRLGIPVAVAQSSVHRRPLTVLRSARGLPPTAEVLVIGGGAIGISIAFHLAEAGVRDVVLQTRPPAGRCMRACSWAAAARPAPEVQRRPYSPQACTAGTATSPSPTHLHPAPDPHRTGRSHPPSQRAPPRPPQRQLSRPTPLQVPECSTCRWPAVIGRPPQACNDRRRAADVAVSDLPAAPCARNRLDWQVHRAIPAPRDMRPTSPTARRFGT